MCPEYVIKGSQLWTSKEGLDVKVDAREARDYFLRNSQPDVKIVDALCPLHLFLDYDESTGQSTLNAKIVSRNEQIEIEAIHENLDHVCTENLWLPVERHSLNEVLELLAEAGIDNLGPLDYSQELFIAVQGKRLSTPIKVSALPKREQKEIKVIPALINATPYPYQVEGFHWLTWLSSAGVGGILGDEMGLGKTLQIIMLLEHELTSHQLPNLIVCPPSLMENWRREIERFIARKALIHHGNQRIFDRETFLTSEVVITSYDAVRRDELILGQIQWNVIALDEAQYIKNESSQRHAAVKKLNKKIGIAVTGTPIENHLSDLWALADFVIPGVLGSSDWFLKSFNDDEASARTLRDIVSPIILRRRVFEVAKDLPPVTMKPVAIEMPIGLATEYVECIKSNKIEKGGVFALISKLRQICCHILEDNQTSVIEQNFGKFEYLFVTLEELFANGNKAIIFAPFTTIIRDLEKWFQEKFPTNQIHTLFGETPIFERQNVVDKFTSDANPGILIMNPKAGGVGLNITTANHVIHFAPDWNPAVMDQASARSFRRGQLLPVTIHNLFYTESVEEYMYERLNSKRELSEIALEDTSSMPSVDELMKVLERLPNV